MTPWRRFLWMVCLCPVAFARAAFAQARAQSVATVRALDDAGWARSGTHATEGVLDVAGLLRMAIDHDEEHLLGIARPG